MKNDNLDLMAWNAPGSNGNNDGDSPKQEQPKQDPWGRNNNPGSSNNDPWGRANRQNNSGDSFLNLLKKLFAKTGGNRSGGTKKVSGLSFVSVIIILLLGVYIFTGFYTVKEAERGVLLRFGKINTIVEPGLSWKFTGIDEVRVVDIEQVRAIQSSGTMLTEDENVVLVEMDVQYRISDPYKYLYSVTDPDNSLMEATDSALRYVVGHTLMDDILTSGREMVRQNTRDLLVSIIEPYDMGLSIVDVNFLPARAPDQVKAAFDDAIAAQEDEQRFKREAEAYANEVLPKADGQVQRINQEAEAYRSQVVLKAQGEVARFEQVLPEYEKAPEITKKRIYLETMQEVLSNSTKVIVDTKEGQSPLLYLPMPQATPVAPKTPATAIEEPKTQVGVNSSANYDYQKPESQTVPTLPSRNYPSTNSSYNNDRYQRGIR